MGAWGKPQCRSGVWRLKLDPVSQNMCRLHWCLLWLHQHTFCPEGRNSWENCPPHTSWSQSGGIWCYWGVHFLGNKNRLHWIDTSTVWWSLLSLQDALLAFTVHLLDPCCRVCMAQRLPYTKDTANITGLCSAKQISFRASLEAYWILAMNALRFCKSSMAPFFYLMLASAALLLWCTQLLDSSTEISISSPIRQSRRTLDLSWVHENQDQLHAAFDLSRTSWPFPENFKPDLDFEGLLVSGLNISESGNGTNGTMLWIFCSGQYDECACYGKIRWGIPLRWMHIHATSSTVANRVACQIGKKAGGPDLPDVSPGDDTKHCECQVNTASYFFRCINVLALPKEQRKKLHLEEGSSCNMFAEDMSVAGRHAWKGVAGICNSSWNERPSGKDKLPAKKMIAAMKTYVFSSFESNYKRLYVDGWLKRAFVSYFSGPLEGLQSQAIELLIESIHRFSVYPIVVLHSGMATPLHWNPHIFPRLVLLSVGELPLYIGHSTTLLLAAVVSHVQTGILLNYNALVFPGIDRLFQATESEIHSGYPYPIMPVHFMDKKASDGGTFWGHVEGPHSSRQSMRWSQFGLFWTTEALPFLGALLRGLLRDEFYDAEPPYEGIKVRNLHDIEAAMNVALWKAGATKQSLGLELFTWPFHAFAFLYVVNCILQCSWEPKVLCTWVVCNNGSSSSAVFAVESVDNPFTTRRDTESTILRCDINIHTVSYSKHQ